MTSRALRASNSAASEWGGGIALVVPCFDASRFEGIEFWIKRETPAGSIVFGVDTRNDASASVELTIPAAWTRCRVAFDQLRLDTSTGERFGGDFRGGPRVGAGAFDGSAVRALVWSSQLRYAERSPLSGVWQAETGAFDITIANVQFY